MVYAQQKVAYCSRFAPFDLVALTTLVCAFLLVKIFDLVAFKIFELVALISKTAFQTGLLLFLMRKNKRSTCPLKALPVRET